MAERLAISRSAAAVHISNLIKKGAILGRGYVFNERQGLIIAGGISWRTAGLGAEQPRRGCCFGPVTSAIEGIAFQMACQLAAEAPLIRFAGVVGRDENGDKIVAALNTAGVDTAQIERSATLPSAHHLEIQWPGGGQSHFDRRIYEALLPDVLHARRELFKNCDLLVLDDLSLACLTEGDLEEIASGTALVVIVLDGGSLWPKSFIPHDNLFYITTAENNRLLDDQYFLANVILMQPGKGVKIVRGSQAEEVFLPAGSVK